MIVLSVGGGTARDIGETFKGWEQKILDIDPATKPDICCDALEMGTLEAESYDAVYCSHNLEHFYKHDVPRVLQGFLHVLKPGGFAEIHVPNIRALMQRILDDNMDIDDVWYRTRQHDQAITFHDVLYGCDALMKRGNLFYAHKCGFTVLSLYCALMRAGFSAVEMVDFGQNIMAKAIK